MEIVLNKDLIHSVARPALSHLILHLQIYRCTADVECGRKYMEDLTAVGEVHARWRVAVLSRRQKPPLFVQGNTFLDGDEVMYKEYPATVEGLIQSWVERDV